MTEAPLSAVVAEVTERIRRRSRDGRQAYLARVRQDAERTDSRERLSCANLAHAFAALEPGERDGVLRQRRPNLGIVTAYNDLLSAHRPYEEYPRVIRDEARRSGATAQVAGATPEMEKQLEAGAEAARADLGDALRKRPGSGQREPGRVNRTN